MSFSGFSEVNHLQKQTGRIVLLGPESNSRFNEKNAVFSWKITSQNESASRDIKQYELIFWSLREDFGKSYSIVPDDSSGREVIFPIDNFRQIFRRHGKYYWKVTAIFHNGETISSETRTFIVVVPNVYRGFSPWNYLYAFKFQYSHRSRTAEYVAFLNSVSQSASLRSFSDLSMVFRQDRILIPFLDIKEKFLILSQVGLGLELSTRFQALKTPYFSFYPFGEIATSWFSLGLENYSTTSNAARVGCEFEMMPRGFVTFRGTWIPAYRIRYSEKSGGLRTFEGDGWEIGLRLIVSHSILATFSLFGMEIDFERIPFEFHYSHITDQFTGTLMKMRRFSVGYLLQ